MVLDKLRYALTKHVEKYMFTYENYMLLIHPSVNDNDLLVRLKDDLDLMPEITNTIDNTEIKFYRYDYKEEIFSKSELLAFILASLNRDWDIIKGIDFNTGKIHFYLRNNDIIYDPSLGVITKEDLYSKRFKQVRVIKNDEVLDYLKENNNLYRFYNKGLFNKKDKDFSINFINSIKSKFYDNIEREYELDSSKEEEIKKYFWHDNFVLMRQVLTKKRKSYIHSSNIAVHPDVDSSVLEVINKYAKGITELMSNEYDVYADYYSGTIGNCYALSILMNLANGDFKLIQGGLSYRNNSRDKFYQHSWLEYKDVVYDPALRVVTPKDLYYRFVEKHDEYSKEETEEIIRKIGFNLTHFKDYLNGVQIGGDETIRYRSSVNRVGSDEFREEGEKLLSLVKGGCYGK